MRRKGDQADANAVKVKQVKGVVLVSLRLDEEDFGGAGLSAPFSCMKGILYVLS